MKGKRRKFIPLAGLAASGILGTNMSGFAIEAAGREAPVSPSQPTDRAVDDKAARRRLARLRSQARLAFGIPSKFGSTSARAAQHRARCVTRASVAAAAPVDRTEPAAPRAGRARRSVVARHRRDARARHRRQPRRGAPRDRAAPADLSSRLRFPNPASLFAPARKYQLDLARTLIDEGDLLLDNDIAESAHLRRQSLRFGG